MELKHITDKVDELKNIERQLEELDKQSKELTKKKEQLSTVDIPAMLDDSNLEKFETDKYQVTTKVAYYGSLPKTDQQPGINFLVENGQAACIKCQLIVEDNLNDDGDAPLVKETQKIISTDIPYEIKYTINHQTLKKALREIMQSDDCPEYFNWEHLTKLHDGDVSLVLSKYFDYDDELVDAVVNKDVDEFPVHELLLEEVAKKLLGVYQRTETVVKVKK